MFPATHGKINIVRTSETVMGLNSELSLKDNMRSFTVIGDIEMTLEDKIFSIVTGKEVL